MRPLGVPSLLLLMMLAAVLGSAGSQVFAARGSAVPLAGWLSGLVLLALAGVLLAVGLPLRRYMAESEQRRLEPTTAPRRHHIDMLTAYRTVLFARASALTGFLIAGLFGGQALFLVMSRTGVAAGLLPTLFAAATALALGILGLVVERWGTLPPQDGADAIGERTPGS
ncbi:MAG: DUF3180 domain-containing protein [Brachybacterium sp.]|nr:DUF3180 domain-containing protein [Brachybacterium sp.]